MLDVDQATVSLDMKNSQLGKIHNDLGEQLGGLDKATISRELQNSQLGKMQQDLGEHWNDRPDHQGITPGIRCRKLLPTEDIGKLSECDIAGIIRLLATIIRV